jgi:hypothetical protein
VIPLAGIPLLLDASSSGELGAGAVTRSGAVQVISSTAVSSASTTATASVAAEREASPPAVGGSLSEAGAALY